MLCKAKCRARMGTPGSSHHHLIAQLQLPCCSFSISAWNKTRGKAGNSEQCPNAVCGCCVPLSLLGGLRSAPAADPLSCPCPCRSHFMLAPRQLDTPPAQLLGTARVHWEEIPHPPSRCGLGSSRGEGSVHCMLACTRGMPCTLFLLGACCGNTHSWTKLWALTWGWKGYPKKRVLPCKVWGNAQLGPYLPLATWSCSLLTPQ